MAKFHATGGGALSDPYNRPVVSEEFAKRFPNLCELFQGSFSEEERVWKIYPCTLTIFVEGGRLKFCVHPRHGTQVAFGSCQDGTGGFSEIEQSLDLGHFEWKNRGGHKRS